jgi:hypothetical protein
MAQVLTSTRSVHSSRSTSIPPGEPLRTANT